MAVVQVSHGGHERGTLVGAEFFTQVGDGVNDMHKFSLLFYQACVSLTGKLAFLTAATYACIAPRTLPASAMKL